ncbi:hypothetical protein QR680_012106 [Steinernema hermaphroditum]|uniref:Peptidase S1 domain-containing protein n=1 Tax=Steinernema hermaphroditum TaxID=289476 RepID=A0AA39I395_9BILA|nr:hypothetical protein QR680_012106 [Steinernema hermaphroditum]
MNRLLLAAALLWRLSIASPLVTTYSFYDAENCGKEQIKTLTLSGDAPPDASLVDLDMDAYSDDTYNWISDNRARRSPEWEDEPLEGEKSGVPWKAMGGVKAKEGELPWAVAITYKNEYRCTGTLISKKHVLTAAHCFVENGHKSVAWNCQRNKFLTEEDAVQHMTVQYGAACLLPDQPACENYTATMTKVNIKKALFRDFYELNGCKGGRDFALLELESEVEGVNHVCLPHLHDDGELRKSGDFFSYGWGSNPEHDKRHMVSPVLQKVGLAALLANEMCRMNWENMPYDGICTSEWSHKDMCEGDSGGGLIVQDVGRNKQKRWFLYGVVSFGSDCKLLLDMNHKGRTQVFTDITMYTATIDQYRCTGTLISKKHVLTAAHCFVENGHKSVAWNCQRNKFLTEEDAVQHMTVQYGAACLLPDQPACENYTATMTKVNIKKALFRDFYELNGCKGGRDFALLQLESEVEGVNHICLPHLYDTTKVHSAKNFHSYGWENDLERENLTSTILQNVILGVLLRAELCKTLWGDMSDDTICAIKWNTYQDEISNTEFGLRVRVWDSLFRSFLSHSSGSTFSGSIVTQSIQRSTSRISRLLKAMYQ